MTLVLMARASYFMSKSAIFLLRFNLIIKKKSDQAGRMNSFIILPKRQNVQHAKILKMKNSVTRLFDALSQPADLSLTLDPEK